jgi:hypothetical protein
VPTIIGCIATPAARLRVLPKFRDTAKANVTGRVWDNKYTVTVTVTVDELDAKNDGCEIIGIVERPPLLVVNFSVS